jgi:hypothetical protein
VQEITTILMNEPDKGTNLVLFSAKGFLMNDHQMEVPQHSYHPRKLSESSSIRCFALELANSSLGASDPVSVAMLFRLVRSLSLI